MNLKRAIALACFASAAMTATAAHADDGWIVRAGATMVDPKSDNLALSATQTLQVDDKIGLTFDITKMWTPHWGTELLLAYPFKHDIDLQGPTGTSSFGSTEHLPPTLSLVYQFLPNSRFRPYLTVGVNYTSFFNEEPGALSLDNSWGPAYGGGIDFAITDNLLVTAWAKYIDIDSDASLWNVTTNARPSVGTVEVDPMVYGLAVGFRFGRPAPVVAAAAPVVAAPAPAPAPPPPPPPPPPPADTDGDGVPDSKDACPDTPKGDRVGPMGCSCDVTVQLQFKFNSAELTEQDIKILEGTAENLRRLNWISGVAEGHTDSTGPDAFNQTLSERRAQSVIDFLASKGIGEARIRAVGFGESKPIADNATAEGRAQNRRVVLRRTDCDEVK